ncbi:MAG: hypothetical protein QNJ65_16140 [Xenococcaceae cyanobacterium MO_234.B1]|nr:hypothetical protein [Xenococcaceae cyanobacterium MO_234.B1]
MPVPSILKVISGKEHTIGVGAHRDAPLQRQMNLTNTWYKYFGKSPNDDDGDDDGC